MKQVYLSAVFVFLFSILVQAIPKYWVGPINGTWNNAANWSLSSGGPGSAGLPTSTDSVVFSTNALVNLDVSPAIAALTVGSTANTVNVTIYTSAEATLSILSNLLVDRGSTLKDSTSAAVAFNTILNGASLARGVILGRWEFEGGTPLGASAGAYFTSQPGAVVTVGNNTTAQVSAIVFHNNSGSISSSATSLIFSRASYFVLENNPDPMLPAAFWYGIDPDASSPTISALPGSNISIQGNIGNLRHLQPGSRYGSIAVNLPNQQSDVNLNFANGTRIQGNFSIAASNGKTINLLARDAPVNAVNIAFTTLMDGGDFTIAGATTKVALSTVAAEDAPVDYRLNVGGSFNQSGGNFSFQDGNSDGGSVAVGIRINLNQTAGTFVTNSTVAKPFRVDMVGPVYWTRPGGTRNLGQTINLHSGSINNNAGTVTLRVSQFFPPNTFTDQERDLGVVLQTPLQVGRLELVRGTLTTSATNLLTVTNPEPGSISRITDSSYIIGPYRFSTAASTVYLIPTGATPTYSGGFYGLTNTQFRPDTARIIPADANLSVYQAEFVMAPYSDTVNRVAPLLGVARDKYWNISRISGSAAAIQLALNGSLSNSSVDKALVVAHYEDNKWIAVNGSVLSPGNSSQGLIISKTISNFSPFTFGIISGTDIPLAIHFTGFTARKTGEGATLDWSVASAPAKFEVMRSGNGTSYTRVGSIDAVNAKTSYQFIDKKILQGTNYYRIKSVEADGNTGLSVVNAVLNSTDAIAINYLAPNQVQQTTRLFINTARPGKLSILVTDMSGKTWKRIAVDVSGGNIEKVLNFGDLPAGVYQLSGSMNGLSTAPLRFVKK